MRGRHPSISQSAAVPTVPALRPAQVVLTGGDQAAPALLYGVRVVEPLDGAAGPVVEAMALQALAGQCALVAVGPAGAALAQLLGPFRTAHDRFPGVPGLRELLDGAPQALDTLRAALTAQDTPESASALRELDVRARQAGRPDDVAGHLADRIARLDRPAFASFFNPAGGTHQVSLRALDRPLRIRIDLPDRGHVEASRIMARLILAQFTESAAARTGNSPPFACLVLADAAQTITADALRGLQRLRSANADAVLTLRSLEDVPPALRGSLLGAVGCRMAFAGVTTWDGTPFAEVWGKEWVETRDVIDRQIIAEGAGMKAMHLFRQAVTGKAVTVRTVERECWSASDRRPQPGLGAALWARRLMLTAAPVSACVVCRQRVQTNRLRVRRLLASVWPHRLQVCEV